MVRSVSSWLEVRTGRNKGSVHMWAAAFGPGLELLCGPQRQEGGVSGYSPQEVGGAQSLPSLVAIYKWEIMSTSDKWTQRRQPPASGRVWTGRAKE